MCPRPPERLQRAHRIAKVGVEAIAELGDAGCDFVKVHGLRASIPLHDKPAGQRWVAAVSCGLSALLTAPSDSPAHSHGAKGSVDWVSWRSRGGQAASKLELLLSLLPRMAPHGLRHPSCAFVLNKRFIAWLGGGGPQALAGHGPLSLPAAACPLLPIGHGPPSQRRSELTRQADAGSLMTPETASTAEHDAERERKLAWW